MQVVTKFANGKQSNIKQLHHLTKYITNPSKTEAGLICGNGLFVENSFENMLLIKKLSNQTDGRQYIHWITSFDPKDNISPELAHELGKQFAVGFNEYQWLMATHTDRNHIHNHYIMNSVNSVTGKKFSQAPGELENLKRFINEIYSQSLLLNCDLPVFYEEEFNMYYDEDSFEILEDEEVARDEIDELRKDIQSLTQVVSVMAKCMTGYMQMCNPQTLSNAISNEVDKQLNQRFGCLPNPNQKYIQE